MAAARRQTAWAYRAVIVLCILAACFGLFGGAFRIADEGAGVLGVNNDIPWGWAVVSFVFWIGLGHAGTLISAVLLLCRQSWRASVARYAELMTLCAIITAGVFPLVHVGRAWMLWQMSPLPVAAGVWPNISSALVWDALAIASYFVLSLLFWLIGMWNLQDYGATVRALRTRVCFLLAVVLTVTVVTVHSVVSCDFAAVFRWRCPDMPPFFVCGALLSGLAAVQLIAVSLRCSQAVRENTARLTLYCGLCMGAFYLQELLHNPHLLTGGYLLMFALNVFLPALYFIPRMRSSMPGVIVISLGVLAGMWWERVHIIICRSAELTGAAYFPSLTDIAMAVGSIGLFHALFLMTCPRICAVEEEAESPSPVTPDRVGRIAVAGAIIGLVATVVWYLLTQDADTAGVLLGRPTGYPFVLPALTVSAAAGAGLALSFLFFNRILRR